jgi:hypothetical protein
MHLEISHKAQVRPLGFRIWKRMTDCWRAVTNVMERHRLAALVLLATYLMMPPPKLSGDNFQINFSAPISKWDQLRRFNSDAECEAALEHYRHKPPGGLSAMFGSRADAAAAMRAARCIPSREPSLD